MTSRGVIQWASGQSTWLWTKLLPHNAIVVVTIILNNYAGTMYRFFIWHCTYKQDLFEVIYMSFTNTNEGDSFWRVLFEVKNKVHGNTFFQRVLFDGSAYVVLTNTPPPVNSPIFNSHALILLATFEEVKFQQLAPSSSLSFCQIFINYLPSVGMLS